MKMGTSPTSYNDVVALSDSANFDRKTVEFATLGVDVVPGQAVTSAGAAYVSGSDCLLALSAARAGSDVPVIVADRLTYVKPATIIAVNGATVGAAAIAALTANGNIRVTAPDAE
ncbi:hypothetical protein [Winslowiella iniecta]|uniref:Head decoration protein n=1 Tax=Winslowiella iniecta TaxID=1560201 RepID=A0A0L7T9Y3_9GAMM|nr:hypothetical protein [Winslowiella iniecta]KOC88838.1 hypothetical protein NG43_19500 [Winslowiella iniecta]KOC92177.1 hypothetical protein NG42_02950 [Winslowiella iniecta]